MSADSASTKARSFMKKGVYSLLGLVFAGIGYAYSESIKKIYQPAADATTHWFITHWHPHRLLEPYTIPWLLLFLVLLGLAAFGLFVLIGNAWIAVFGPNLSQYRQDVFYGYRWTWRWGKRIPDIVPRSQEISNLTPFCQQEQCNGVAQCGVVRHHEIWAQQGDAYPTPYMKCETCGHFEQMAGFRGPDPCMRLEDAVRKQILEKIHNGKWKDVARKTSSCVGRLTLSFPTFLDRWFGRP